LLHIGQVQQPQYIGTFAKKGRAICRHQIFSIFLFAYFFFALTDQWLSLAGVTSWRIPRLYKL
jgi:hypothetical protein